MAEAEVGVEQSELIDYIINMSQQYGMDPSQFAQMLDGSGQAGMMWARCAAVRLRQGPQVRHGHRFQGQRGGPVTPSSVSDDEEAAAERGSRDSWNRSQVSIREPASRGRTVAHNDAAGSLPREGSHGVVLSDHAPAANNQGCARETARVRHYAAETKVFMGCCAPGARNPPEKRHSMTSTPIQPYGAAPVTPRMEDGAPNGRTITSTTVCSRNASSGSAPRCVTPT